MCVTLSRGFPDLVVTFRTISSGGPILLAETRPTPLGIRAWDSFTRVQFFHRRYASATKILLKS